MRKPENGPTADPRDAIAKRDRALLAQALVAARKQRRYSQAALARGAGVDRGHLGNVETGKADLTFDLLMKLLEALQMEPGNFFGRPELSALRKEYSRGPRSVPGQYVRRVHEPYDRMLGGRIEYERGRRMTQAQLARSAGIARAHLSRIENSDKEGPLDVPWPRTTARPTVIVVLALLRAMKIDPAKFFAHIHLHPAVQTASASNAPGERGASD